MVLQPEIIEDPTPEEVAAAIKAKPDYLVTYDHKDLLDPPEVALPAYKRDAKTRYVASVL